MSSISWSKRMLSQQHHQTQNQTQILSLIQLRSQRHLLQNPSLYPDRPWHSENSCDEKNETSRKYSRAYCDTSSSYHHQTHLSCLFWTLIHVSLTHSSCSIYEISQRNCCGSAWICFQFPREDNQR